MVGSCEQDYGPLNSIISGELCDWLRNLVCAELLCSIMLISLYKLLFILKLLHI